MRKSLPYSVVAVLMLLLSGCVSTSNKGIADARVVVMPIQGSEPVHGAVVEAVEGRYHLVPSSRYAKAARKLDAKSRKSKDIRKVASKLDIDALVHGKVVKMGKRNYELRLSLRAGDTGEEFDSVKMKLHSKHISAKERRRIQTRLYAALSEIDSWNAEAVSSHKEHSSRSRGHVTSKRGEQERERARKIREKEQEREMRKEEARLAKEEKRRAKKEAAERERQARKSKRRHDDEDDYGDDEDYDDDYGDDEDYDDDYGDDEDYDDDYGDDDEDYGDDDYDDDDDVAREKPSSKKSSKKSSSKKSSKKAKKPSKDKKKSKKKTVYKVKTERDDSGQAIDDESPF